MTMLQRRRMTHQTVLVQSGKLTRARFDKNMTWPEFKVFLITAAQLTSKDQDLVEFTTTVNDLCELANLGTADPGRYQRVHHLLETITKRGVVIFKEAEEGGTERIYAQFFSEARYVEETRQIVFRLHPRMKEYLLQLKNYTLAKHLLELTSLDSVAQARFYMLVCDCCKLWNPALRTFPVLELAQILGLDVDVRSEPESQVAYRIRRIYAAIQKKGVDISFTLTFLKLNGRWLGRLNFPKHQKAVANYD